MHIFRRRGGKKEDNKERGTEIRTFWVLSTLHSVIFSFIIYLFGLFRATSVAYGGSQARG